MGRLWISQPSNSFPGNEQCDDDERHAVDQRCKNADSMVAKCHSLMRRLPRHPQRIPREAKGCRIGEIVAGVGNQRQTVRKYPAIASTPTKPSVRLTARHMRKLETSRSVLVFVSVMQSTNQSVIRSFVGPFLVIVQAAASQSKKRREFLGRQGCIIKRVGFGTCPCAAFFVSWDHWRQRLAWGTRGERAIVFIAIYGAFAGVKQ